MNSITPNLNIMIKACEKASKVIIRDFGEVENLQLIKKGPRDFVTKTDKRVEEILINELAKSKKNYSFLTEESGKIENNDKDEIWVIDPIDGTINFLHGVPHFAISVAHQSEGEIVSGLIFDPIKNEMFYADKNNGAFFNNHRIRVSKKNNIEDCLFGTGGKLVKEPDISFRKSGSAALDMAYVAAGRYDGFFQKNLNLWDIAAGIILVKEAGGIVNDLDLEIYKNIEIIASSPSINQKLKDEINT
mgnify:CR=1 FL=1|tara:strand:- start:2499 stop:3236 length:738 start_codon:yes stop_codon:yes gene_type:complete